ncbi:hypothetical protein Q9Q94_07135 [Uliginosibacterium sp. 31-16]|uniref:hypothetical protein n=1 Tax=Uliginosibacterium sp. 31-16 TaxID=3068315 RepID=UPI00273EA865|nr:hypothetical protein [Uliginosibacterium sp. 31-16]MDP5239297.1 hypothetical protein [Uliginosibacterium sp. 31-16]
MIRASAAILLALAAMTANAEEEFKFDASEFDKKPYEFNGYLEQKFETLKLRGDSSAYRLAFPGEPAQDWLQRSTSTLELSGKANYQSLAADVRAQASYQGDDLVHTTNYGQVMEGGLRWSVGPELSFDIGKRVQRWGKGYAWSPVGLVERPKDPSDPTASREGFVMASGEWTRSFSGPVSSINFTGMVVPTNDNLNNDFGREEDLNPAAKLYLLAFDTDIDLMWRGKGAKPEAFGIDFSRNLTPALEVHGEWARTLDAPRNTVSASGLTSSGQINFNSWLLGLRYLTKSEVTWVAEYYRNGAGYSANQLDDYYAFLDRALAPGASPALSSKARTVAQSGYGKANPGTDYLYLKASVSEPFDWVYGAASVTAMTNLKDGSWQLQPEVSYTGFANWELRSRVIFFGGQPNAEFPTKSSSMRVEAYARYFF